MITKKEIERSCFTCGHYIAFTSGELVEICLKHKIRIQAEEGICCKAWYHENLYDHLPEEN